MKLVDKDYIYKCMREIAECDECGDLCVTENAFCDMGRLRKMILEAPEIDPVKHAHWINLGVVEYYMWLERHELECSNCGLTVRSLENDYMKYCPGCGARMDEDER